LRFAFYGRMSTVEFHDRETSLGWQREVAEETIRGRGRVPAQTPDVPVATPPGFAVQLDDNVVAGRDPARRASTRELAYGK
jgi:hypothetical protein